MKWAVAIALVAYCCVLAIMRFTSEPPVATEPAAPAQEPTPEKNMLVQLSDRPIGDHIKSDFDKFASPRGAYGAFYITPNGNVSGWGSGMFSQDEADAHARIKCEARSGKQCEVYARIVPPANMELVENDPQFSTGWRKIVKETEQGKFSALAANGWIARGASTNADSKQEAEAEALKNCRGDIDRFREFLVASMRKAAEEIGLFECRIVGLKAP